MTNLKKVKKLKLTWELLEKEESELTPAEKILVDEHHQHVEKLADELDKANAELRENCKIVTSGPETDDDFKKLAKNINASMKNLYKKDSKTSLDGKEWL